jgi:hypothetical protein
MPHPKLVVGQVYAIPETGRLYRVLRVGHGSATVQALGARHVVVRDSDGDVQAEFDSPGRRFEVSTSAAGVRIVEAPCDTE